MIDHTREMTAEEKARGERFKQDVTDIMNQSKTGFVSSMNRAERRAAAKAMQRELTKGKSR